MHGVRSSAGADIIIGKRHPFFREARHAVHKKYSTDIVLLYYYSKHGPAESPQ